MTLCTTDRRNTADRHRCPCAENRIIGDRILNDAITFKAIRREVSFDCELLLPAMNDCMPGAYVDKVVHNVRTMLAGCGYGIALGYEDLDNHQLLPCDPVMQVLAGCAPDNDTPPALTVTRCRFEDRISRQPGPVSGWRTGPDGPAAESDRVALEFNDLREQAAHQHPTWCFIEGGATRVVPSKWNTPGRREFAYLPVWVRAVRRLSAKRSLPFPTAFAIGHASSCPNRSRSRYHRACG
jgi:hypothetical protein